MGRRTILLIAAIVVAALGTALVFLYANRAEDLALQGQAPVEVLVATTGIQSGTSGSAISEAGAVELKKLPAASVPADALSDLTPVAELLTLGSVFEGQVLLQPMFGTPQEASGGLALPEGKMGVSVELSDPQRVAGFVKPGSEVAVFVSVPAPSARRRPPRRGRPRPRRSPWRSSRWPSTRSRPSGSSSPPRPPSSTSRCWVPSPRRTRGPRARPPRPCSASRRTPR